MKNSIYRIALILWGLTLVTCAATPVTAQSQEGIGQVSVSGAQILRDGRPWVPHGFYQIPFEVPPGAFHIPHQKLFWEDAFNGFSSFEYEQMRAQGADSVRLQIAQDGADPENRKFFNPEWLQQAIEAIQAARAAGLTVIVSIQDEMQTGVKEQAPLPNDATRRVWRELTPVFGSDRGVLFELYNEPSIGEFNPEQRPSAQDWQMWAAAMNETLAFVRALGSVNVVVADGLQRAQQLSGAPKLNDPLHQVIYAAHPYSNNAMDQTPETWDAKFGNFSRTEPVIISEWGIGFYCDANTPASVVGFLQYLQNHNLGLEAGIWDFAPHTFRSLIQGFPDGVFSSFFGPQGERLACNQANDGPGKTVESWYETGVPPISPQ